MVDRISAAHRSWNMSRIRSKDTAPEKTVRSTLHRMGYRFRLHRTDLPGRPDIVLAGHKAIIFVHGCFWHRHPRCKLAYTPKSSVEFWQAKFESNVQRDKQVRQELEQLGWKVITIWECQTTNRRLLADQLQEHLSRKT